MSLSSLGSILKFGFSYNVRRFVILLENGKKDSLR